ncbi:RcnB family protein [Stenotrophomonas maltophilia]|uniref:RcnB family protein n=1 Tax=Stenotrophomonas forensis TaxID=2871169 RepID=UPI0018D3A4E0|nr:RcnB family protein [Stenotrophomonas maltophilia]MBH1600451.1 RcnB family protein [Stenotrophomonas maltophilia]
MNTSLRLSRYLLGGALVVLPLLGGVSTASAERHPGGGPHMGAVREEPMRSPLGYTRMERPREITNARPQFRDEYRHNFRADHAFRIGPYHPPVGFQYRRWHYGEILPRPFWVGDYILNDFWLFDLDFPPVGYEWVRFGPDALLINTGNGEIVQTVYGRFI